MRISKKQIKATVVVLIIGITIVFNTQRNYPEFMGMNNPIQVLSSGQNTVKDTVNINKANVLVFTESVIKSGIREFISSF